jgi:hypothetical protein
MVGENRSILKEQGVISNSRQMNATPMLSGRMAFA